MCKRLASEHLRSSTTRSNGRLASEHWKSKFFKFVFEKSCKGNDFETALLAFWGKFSWTGRFSFSENLVVLVKEIVVVVEVVVMIVILGLSLELASLAFLGKLVWAGRFSTQGFGFNRDSNNDCVSNDNCGYESI